MADVCHGFAAGSARIGVDNVSGLPGDSLLHKVSAYRPDKWGDSWGIYARTFAKGRSSWVFFAGSGKYLQLKEEPQHGPYITWRRSNRN